jgi:hypothetical protein
MNTNITQNPMRAKGQKKMKPPQMVQAKKGYLRSRQGEFVAPELGRKVLPSTCLLGGLLG